MIARGCIFTLPDMTNRSKRRGDVIRINGVAFPNIAQRVPTPPIE